MKRIFAALLVVCCLLLSACGEKPAAPKSLSASLENGAAVISWEESGQAKTYRLYRRAPKDSDYKFIFDSESGETSYTDRWIEGGGTYLYKLEIIGENGVSDALESTLNVPSEKKGESVIPPETPVISSVTAMDSYTAVVSVKPQEGCTYEFMRADTSGGEYTLAATTDEPFFYDQNESKKTDWSYKVRAVKGGLRSELSQPAKTGYNSGTVFGVPVLMYHEFVTQEDLDSGIDFDEYAIYADEFEGDLKWLQKNGYTTITTKQLIDYLEGSGSLPAKPVILTIDDGKYGVYKRAFPLLKQYKMQAVLSVIGYEIDYATDVPTARSKSKAPYCNWQELKEMSDSGAVEMISHTDKQHFFSHDGRCGASTKDDDTLETFMPIAQKDRSDTVLKFRKNFNTEPLAMAYPYSRRSELSDEAWFKCGYKILCSGDDEQLRASMTNYFVREAGINKKSGVLRRVARMTGRKIDHYFE